MFAVHKSQRVRCSACLAEEKEQAKASKDENKQHMDLKRSVRIACRELESHTKSALYPPHGWQTAGWPRGRGKEAEISGKKITEMVQVR